MDGLFSAREIGKIASVRVAGVVWALPPPPPSPAITVLTLIPDNPLEPYSALSQNPKEINKKKKKPSQNLTLEQFFMWIPECSMALCQECRERALLGFRAV